MCDISHMQTSWVGKLHIELRQKRWQAEWKKVVLKRVQTAVGKRYAVKEWKREKETWKS